MSEIILIRILTLRNDMISSAICNKYSDKYSITTSFPGSLFSASIVVETMEAEKRDPGNEVDSIIFHKHEPIMNALISHHRHRRGHGFESR